MFRRKEKLRPGDWRIQEAREGGQFWIERYEFAPGLLLCGAGWRPYPRSLPKTYSTEAEAEQALQNFIAGPRTVATFDKAGAPV